MPHIMLRPMHAGGRPIGRCLEQDVALLVAQWRPRDERPVATLSREDVRRVAHWLRNIRAAASCGGWTLHIGGGGARPPGISGRLLRRLNFTSREHCDVLSMQIDSDLVIYRTTLVRIFQVVTICRVDKSEPPPPCLPRAAAAAFPRRTCSGHREEEFPSVLISSGLLVQADEGVSLPVVDLIDESTAAYREEPVFL
ncbi:hypothetical protein F511_17932 [Dorcoceras hygrometricum]|uniref:Uncharacterized protein n=1 Tax=Dorcoceras hygrometricum TaxID=472368 RepID=A0A2Z7ARL0_9LAMI|nr:hypothetical protein F511_17932 [Dorcoceras hygrometricum]